MKIRAAYYIKLALAGLMLSGCASKAGPFVTNVSSDGDGGLLIEKCMVRLDRMINTVENADCTTSPIKLKRASAGIR
ncbi:hypothetical protein [Nitrosococcus halophilus]|nr:hypothetical protein [Nitrosococcus halophilus]